MAGIDERQRNRRCTTLSVLQVCGQRQAASPIAMQCRGQEGELLFPGRDRVHTEAEFLLKARGSTTMFTALAPSFSLDRIKGLMADKKLGAFHIAGSWLGDTPTVRRYRFST